MHTIYENSDLMVFSSQRWNNISDRSQYILGCFAQQRRVYYFEEAIFGITDIPRIHVKETSEGLMVVEPYLPASLKTEEVDQALRDLVDELIYEEEIRGMTVWFENEKSHRLFEHLNPCAVMDARMIFNQENDLGPDATFMRMTDMEREIPKTKSPDFIFHTIHPITVNMSGVI